MRPTINVIDMYHGNAAKISDFTALKAVGVYGIIHKASEGLHYRDPAYAVRRAAAHDAGLLWGAYHFLHNSDIEGQAENFLGACGITEPDSEPFLLACDFENSDAQPSLQQCLKFMTLIDRASPPGVSCVLYSGNLIRETLKPHQGGQRDGAMAGAEAFFQQHRLWLAQYGPSPNVPWPWNTPVVKTSDQSVDIPAPGVWLWQFTETGRVNPLIGKTDGNFFDGTFDELKARWLA